jgi:hypothetical protein
LTLLDEIALKLGENLVDSTKEKLRRKGGLRTLKIMKRLNLKKFMGDYYAS